MAEERKLRLHPWRRLVRLARRIGGAVRRRLDIAREILRPPVVLFQGIPSDGDQVVTVMRSGLLDDLGESFFVGRIFKEIRRQQTLGRQWAWKIPGLARRHSCEFVLARVAKRWKSVARWVLVQGSARTYFLPLFVEASVEIEDEQRLLSNRSLKEDVRKVRKRGFDFDLSRSKEALAVFDESYRRPYYAKAHGLDSVIIDYDHIMKSSEGPEVGEAWRLLRVHAGGEWVAGMIIRHDESGASLWELGVKNGDPTHVKMGALWAAYWFSIQYLRERGYTKASFMYVRPFLRCGVLQYKLKYQPQLSAPLPFGILLFVTKNNELTRGILLNEPFIQEKGTTLNATYFVRASNDELDERSRRLWALGGFQEPEAVLLDETSV